MGDVLISIGSNVNDRQENIRVALDRMTAFFLIDNISSTYESEPRDYSFQGWFLNIVVSGFFNNDPLELLRLLKELENDMERDRMIDKGPRNIDLDIIAFADFIINTNELVIPHPKMVERKFVLLPVKEVNPDFVHPILNKDIDILINECPDVSKIDRIGHLWRKEEFERSDVS